MTTAESAFILLFEGIDLPRTQSFSVRDSRLTAKLESGVPWQLTVKLVDVPEQEAQERAMRFAEELYRRFLLRFGGSIKRSEPPKFLRRTFRRGNSISATVKAEILPALTAATAPAPLSQVELDALAGDLEL